MVTPYLPLNKGFYPKFIFPQRAHLRKRVKQLGFGSHGLLIAEDSFMNTLWFGVRYSRSTQPIGPSKII